MFGRWASRAPVCYAVTAIFVAALLYPLSYSKSHDSFPLSSFPMFARRMPDPTLVQVFLIATAGPDVRLPIPPELIGTSEVLQAQATIRGAVRRGREALRAFCEQVAARVAADPSFDRARHVRVIKGRYNAIDYLTGADREGVEKNILTCEIAR